MSATTDFLDTQLCKAVKLRNKAGKHAQEAYNVLIDQLLDQRNAANSEISFPSQNPDAASLTPE